MKRKYGFLFSLILLLMIPTTAYGQLWTGIIDPSRAIDWSNAGVPGGIPNRTTICATLSPGATSAQINSAIGSCPANQVVFLNAGTYNLSSGIVFNNKSNVTLRGAGPDKTFLIFSNGTSCTGLGGDLCIENGDTNDGYDGPSNIATWTAGYSVGTTSITLGAVTLGSISNLQVGSVLFLDQADDTSDTGQVYVCQTINVCSMEVGSLNGRVGRGQQQPVVVTSISGSGPWTIGISPGIRMPNIVSGKSPQVWWLNGLPVQNDGIENLSMDHTNTNSAIAAGTFLMNSYKIWFKNIRDINSQHKHIWAYQTVHMTVRDSYFYGSWNAASESYGIDTYDGADNLVENNIFEHIATAMIHEGCIGCVEGYNFAIDDYYTANGTAPGWQQAGSYHHSVGDAFILYEGNQGVGMTSDDVHGTSNFLTAFRNYWNGRDPAGGGTKNQQTNAIILNAYSRYYNIIGNVLGTSGYHNNYIAATPLTINCNTSIYSLGWGGNCGSGPVPDDPFVLTTLMLWGNYDTLNAAARFLAAEVPVSISQFANALPLNNSLPNSFYLNAKPSWWGTTPWPAVGPDVTAGNVSGVSGQANNLPAQLCYANSPVDSSYAGAADRGVLLFNANNCYGTSGTPPAPPTNLSIVVN